MKFTVRGASGKEKYFIDKKQVTQEEFDRAWAEEKARLPALGQIETGTPDNPATMGNRPWSRPILSQALQYHPRQVDEARSHFKSVGLDPEKVRNDGRVEMGDIGAKREILKRLKMHDNNCYN